MPFAEALTRSAVWLGHRALPAPRSQPGALALWLPLSLPLAVEPAFCPLDLSFPDWKSEGFREVTSEMTY